MPLKALSFVKKRHIENQYQCFDVVKPIVLHRKRAYFSMQKSLFYNAKQQVLQHINNQIIT